ncbi:MAG TPA: hypothetical protein PKJ33_02585 [Alphaproteobacteria bacterium]|nr:hypothetical protein [Alphaproteobacteria bacterium]
MKKITLLFAVCFALLGMQKVFADDSTDAARAATRGTATVVVSSHQKSEDYNSSTETTSLPSSASRSVVGGVQKSDSSRDRAVTNRDNSISDKSRTSQTNPVTVPRSASVQQRTAKISERSAVSRSGINQTSNVTVRSSLAARSALKTQSRGNISARAATMDNAPKQPLPDTKSTKTDNSKSSSVGYKKCREVYYGCMDEFCANKDTQLKRCACSSRIHDFDSVKKNMSNVEDKILDFNQRLVSVNLDKEDAAAISKETEGEKAYQQTDKSDSKSILDEISKKLKSSTTDTDYNKNLSAISLSLDTDSAFDSIDSSLGASTTSKEGTDLYDAAIPVCREMAAEVCDSDGAAIAESGYQMAIEQDCNTVAKAYETLQDQALTKVREGSALLDMSRLDVHQKENADDILTCKKKMLTMITDSSVCGKNLIECLDISGRYIDPSTGEAFLTENLINMEKLITRPSGNQKWVEVSGNSQFITYLNSKKKYLESSMESCKDIADTVWDDFVEDALAQIKLAQEKKLEDMRQSCTSLTTQCLADTSKSISDFDARALSTFGVTADKTVNEMCAGIKTACTALLESTGGDSDWVGGMSEIQTDKTYDTLIQTCREVGKACIIQTCKSVSGNFGLCESVDKSVNRKSIINRAACWSDVIKCVANAGTSSIDSIMKKFSKTPSSSGGNFYTENYGVQPTVSNSTSGAGCDPTSSTTPQNCIYDICTECGQSGQPDCATCRLAEKIWGNCEFIPTKTLDIVPQNKIKATISSTETLLSWFDTNTGTTDSAESCRDTSCGAGFRAFTTDGVTTCSKASDFSSDNLLCPTKQFLVSQPAWKNCCSTEEYDDFGNCCQDTPITVSGISICRETSDINVFPVASFTLSSDSSVYKAGTNIMVCVGGTIDVTTPETAWPSGRNVKCNGGHFVIINTTYGTYVSPYFNLDDIGNPTTTTNQHPTYPSNYYSLDYDAATNTSINCIYNFESNTWNSSTGSGVCDKITGYPTNNNNLFIKY